MSGTRRSDPTLRATWLTAIVLGALTVGFHLGGLSGPFVFDDIPSIRDNPSLHRLWPLSVPLSPPGEGATVSGRPVLNLSFALNTAAGAGPVGLRLTNLAIHVCAGWLLLGLVRRTLSQTQFSAEVRSAALPLAVMISGLWLLHPLQTASVTYIVQRAESLMGFFYLLTLYAFARGADSPRPAGWFAGAWLACLLGMATKEVMVSAPVLVACYDRLFLSQSWSEVWQRRKRVHVALAATWLLLAWLVQTTGGRGGHTGFSLGVGWATYAATQFEVLVRYLLLTVWPHSLVLDHGVRWVRHAGEIVPYAGVVIALVIVTVRAFTRAQPFAFLGLFFFAVLAPTSLMPGGRQTFADHRMYLPLAALLAGLVIWAHRQMGARIFVAGAALLLVSGVLTFRRTLDYRSTLSIWADTVAKRPDNRWARDNLGNALLERDRPAEALPHYEAALALEPNDPVHHFNTGNALVRLDRVPDAIARFTEAVRLHGNYLPARTNLGNALCRVGRFDEAIMHYAVVVRADPNQAEHHANLGDALFHAGRIGEAVAAFRASVRLQPENPDLAYALGSILLQTGAPGEAVPEFERLLRLRPVHPTGHLNLGSAFAQLGRVDAALHHTHEAVRLDPGNAEAHNNLGAIYLHLGRREEAFAEFSETLRLRPDHLLARENLARLQRTPPRP